MFSKSMYSHACYRAIEGRQPGTRHSALNGTARVYTILSRRSRADEPVLAGRIHPDLPCAVAHGLVWTVKEVGALNLIQVAIILQLPTIIAKRKTCPADVVIITVRAGEVKVQVLALWALPQATISISFLRKIFWWENIYQVQLCFFVYLHFLHHDTWCRWNRSCNLVRPASGPRTRTQSRDSWYQMSTGNYRTDLV